MGKKKNKQMNDFGDSTADMEDVVPFPTKFERDVLSTMNDEELHKTQESLFDCIERVVKYGLNPYPWEVELCYLQQEIQVRSIRLAAHHNWLNSGAQIVASDSTH